MRGHVRHCAALLLLIVSAGSPVLGQKVHGVVRDSATGAAIPGAVVAVMDSLHDTSVRALADEQGRFTLSVAPGRGHVSASRIGFYSRDVTLKSTDGELDIRLARATWPLRPPRSTKTATCPASTDDGAASALWEQVRAGLLAAIVSRDVRPVTLVRMRFSRDLAADGSRLTHQTIQVDSGVDQGSLVVRKPPRELATLGYVREGEDGAREFGVPNVNVLFDPVFQATHCLRLARADSTHQGQIGLGFEPKPGRDSLVDVKGTIWIDPGSFAFTGLDFFYTGLESAAESRGVGGRVSFGSGPLGSPLLSGWTVVVPILRVVPGAPADSSRLDGLPKWRRRQLRRDLTVVAVKEIGAEAVAASWSDGGRWLAPSSGISGRVTEGGSGRSLDRVIVSVEGISESALTDSLGRFTLALLPGHYAVTATDTTLASVGDTRSQRTAVDVVRGRSTALAIAIAPRAPRFGTLSGTVVGDTSTAPVVDAEVSIPLLRRSVKTNVRGEFFFDSLPPGTYDVLVRHVGFAPLSELLPIAGAGALRRQYALGAHIAVLDTVHSAAAVQPYLSPRLREVEDRRLHGGLGRYITDTTLRKEEGRRFVDVLQSKIPGVMIKNGRGGKVYLAQMRVAGLSATCAVDVWMDGIKLGDNDLSSIDVTNLTAVEYYTVASVPAQYNNSMGNGCGALLLWTRERE